MHACTVCAPHRLEFGTNSMAVLIPHSCFSPERTVFKQYTSVKFDLKKIRGCFNFSLFSHSHLINSMGKVGKQ